MINLDNSRKLPGRLVCNLCVIIFTFSNSLHRKGNGLEQSNRLSLYPPKLKNCKAKQKITSPTCSNFGIANTKQSI